MQIEMLNAIKHTSKNEIKKDDVDIYNAEKHRLPCWECPVRPVCFSEKKATKRAKYLRYTVEFKTPCIESILAMGIINIANSDLLITPLNEIDDMTISELSKDSFYLFTGIEGDLIDGPKFGPEMYVMLILITQRDSNKFENDFANAYYSLGDIFQSYFKEIDHAIDLYSKAIDFKPEEPGILYNRGCCFFEKNDFKNALNDFKKVKEIDGEQLYDLADTIEECERMI